MPRIAVIVVHHLVSDMTNADIVTLLKPIAKDRDKYNRRVPNFAWTITREIENHPTMLLNYGAQKAIIDIVGFRYGTAKAEEVEKFFKCQI